MQEAKVAAFVGLRDRIEEQFAVSAPVVRFVGRTGRQTALDLGLLHVQRQLAAGDVELNLVAGLDGRQRPADGGFRRDVQYVSAEAGPAHPGV